MLTLARVDAFAFRVPIAEPIKVAFGSFRDRPMVIVRVVDADGAVGWGEVWSNWPAVGAEHRARLAVDLGGTLIGRPFERPEDVFGHLTRLTEVLILQTGEVGPVTQVIAGLDIAIWDMVARRAGQSLARYLNPTPQGRVAVYATGINPDGPEHFAAARLAEGHRAFKLKIGFDRARDLRNIAAVREAIGKDCTLMIDANQSLDLETALAVASDAARHDMTWLEEPLRVDAPPGDWDRLCALSPIPLAGGENLRGEDFDRWIARGLLRFVQPDITKWGGVTGGCRVAATANASGADFCPHVFGGGLASLASLHVLAAAPGAGTLEMDCHPNAGRSLILRDLLPLHEGTVPVPDGPGLGADVDLAALWPFVTWTSDTATGAVPGPVR